MTRIACIGLGAMGGSVAERLISQGANISVSDLSAEAVAKLQAKGATALSPESVGDCDVLITSLPNDAAVRAALLDSGVLNTPGLDLLIELSTILPDTMREIEAAATGHDVRVVDAPVSGGPAEALAGTLTLLVGADEDALELARPILEQLGTIEHVGPAGHGKAAKLVNNTMTVGNMAVAAEAFTLGVKLGLEPHRLFDVLSRSGGRSHHFQKRIPYALERDFSARFALQLSEKDIRLALQMGHDACYAMPVASAVHQMYELARAHGLAEEDMVAVIKIYEQWANLDEHGAPKRH